MKIVKTLGLSILFVSCVGLKKVVKSNIEVKEKSAISLKKDSSNIVDRNLAISDDLSVSLRTNDKRVDSIIRRRLKGFNISKKSGSNSYKASFDYDRLALSIAAVIGETKSQITTNNTELESNESKTSEASEYFYSKIRIVPWWLWCLIAFFLLPKIINALGFYLKPFKPLFKHLLKEV